MDSSSLSFLQGLKLFPILFSFFYFPTFKYPSVVHYRSVLYHLSFLFLFSSFYYYAHILGFGTELKNWVTGVREIGSLCISVFLKYHYTG